MKQTIKQAFGVLMILTLVMTMMLAGATPAYAKSREPKTTVTFSHSGTLTMTVGESVTVTASTQNPEGAEVTWTSSKAKVAIVSGETITATGEGSATITARSGKGKAKLKVKVVDPNKPTGVSIAQGKSVTVEVGQSIQLSASVSPSSYTGGVAWNSSKPKVAVVDGDGNVTGVKQGTTTITAKCGKKKAKVKVKVVGASEQTHTHSFTEPVYATCHVVDIPAWDETVVTKAAWDETVTVKEAWTETVVDKAAWTERIWYDESKYECKTCGKTFNGYDEWHQECLDRMHNATLECVSKCISTRIMQEGYGCRPDKRKQGNGKRACHSEWRLCGTP